MNYRLSVEGLVEARKRLDDVGLRANRPEPALKSRAMRQAFRENEQRVFAKNRFTRNTKKWDARKRRHGLSPKRMRASGLLFRILTSSSLTGVGAVSYVRWQAFNGTLTAGLYGGRSRVYYARVLADRDKKRIVVKADRRFKPDASAIVQRYVAEVVLS